MMRTDRFGRIAPIAAIAVALAALAGCGGGAVQEAAPRAATGGGAGAKAATLRLAELSNTASAMTHLASARGTFAAEGVDVVTVSVPAGPDVVSALRAGWAAGADVGNLAETPIVTMIGAGDEPVVVATTYTTDRYTSIVTFAATGVTGDQRSLKGKKVGLVRTTIGEAYLNRLLAKAGLTIADVATVNARPADLRSMILRGDIDAVALWEPYTTQIKRMYAEQVKSGAARDRGEVKEFVDTSLVLTGLHLVTTRGKLDRDRAGLTRMIRGLIAVEKSLADDPNRAQADLEGWLGLVPGDLGNFIRTSKFRVAIDVPALSRELAAGLAELKAAQPDSRNPSDLTPFIDTSLLREIDPRRVTDPAAR
jgi:ABC-type nitrate/sulfonate/bicarbonate transport system substrate-binding protein